MGPARRAPHPSTDGCWFLLRAAPLPLNPSSCELVFIVFFPLFSSLVRVEPRGAGCGGGAGSGPVPRSVHRRRASVRPGVSGVWAVSAAKGEGGAPFSLDTVDLVGCRRPRPWADEPPRASACPPPVCPPARPPTCRSAWCIHCRLPAARSQGALFAAAEQGGRGRARAPSHYNPGWPAVRPPPLGRVVQRTRARAACRSRPVSSRAPRTVRRANDAVLGA